MFSFKGIFTGYLSRFSPFPLIFSLLPYVYHSYTKLVKSYGNLILFPIFLSLYNHFNRVHQSLGYATPTELLTEKLDETVLPMCPIRAIY